MAMTIAILEPLLSGAQHERLGNMASWCFPGGTSKQEDNAYVADRMTRNKPRSMCSALSSLTSMHAQRDHMKYTAINNR
jgi:hypothetical protein